MFVYGRCVAMRPQLAREGRMKWLSHFILPVCTRPPESMISLSDQCFKGKLNSLQVSLQKSLIEIIKFDPHCWTYWPSFLLHLFRHKFDPTLYLIGDADLNPLWNLAEASSIDLEAIQKIWQEYHQLQNSGSLLLARELPLSPPHHSCQIPRSIRNHWRQQVKFQSSRVEHREIIRLVQQATAILLFLRPRAFWAAMNWAILDVDNARLRDWISWLTQDLLPLPCAWSHQLHTWRCDAGYLGQSGTFSNLHLQSTIYDCIWLSILSPAALSTLWYQTHRQCGEEFKHDGSGKYKVKCGPAVPTAAL